MEITQPIKKNELQLLYSTLYVKYIHFIGLLFFIKLFSNLNTLIVHHLHKTSMDTVLQK